MTQYTNYEQVPWYRRSGINSLFMVVGYFIFPPLFWFVCYNILTGDIYYNSYDKDGKIKVWPKANKWIAAIMLVIQLYFFARIFMQ